MTSIGHTYANTLNYNRLKKIHEWSNNTKEQQRFLKLKSYVRELCIKIGNLESPHIFDNIVDITLHVITNLHDVKGIKRGNVKNGIICVCIYYTCKQFASKNLDYNYISKILDLPMKYITNAEKLILELINSGKISLKKDLLLSNNKPIDYLTNSSIIIPNDVLTITIKLINLCDQHDILSDNSPVSIGVSCLYYVIKNVIKDKMYNTTPQSLSNIYNVSIVTITKTYNKLIKYNDFILKFLFE